MKAGTVVSIRVNPRDCQSVLDVMDASGVAAKGLSYSQMVSLALSSLLETARKGGLIPEPDEFSFLERMHPYLKTRPVKGNLVAKQLHGLGGRLRAPAIATPAAVSPGAEVHPEDAGMMPADAADPEALRDAQARLTELLAKRDLSDDSPDVVWSRFDQQEFDQCYKVVYPMG